MYLGCLTEIGFFDFVSWILELGAFLFVWWLLELPVFEQSGVVKPSGSSGWGCSGTWIWLGSYCRSHSYMVTSSESSAWTWLAGWKSSIASKEDTAVACEALLLISAERWLGGWFELTTTSQGCKYWWELLRTTPLAVHWIVAFRIEWPPEEFLTDLVVPDTLNSLLQVTRWCWRFGSNYGWRPLVVFRDAAGIFTIPPFLCPHLVLISFQSIVCEQCSHQACWSRSARCISIWESWVLSRKEDEWFSHFLPQL